MTYADPSREDFEVAVICALGSEGNAVEAIFDFVWTKTSKIGREASDDNVYTLGLIGAHHVVLAWMPKIGQTSAAVVAVKLRSSFTKIKQVLVVGICGGAPQNQHGEEILLGDVIISTAVKIVDVGKQYPSGFHTEETIKKPDNAMGSLLTRLGSMRGCRRLTKLSHDYAIGLLETEDYANVRYPGAHQDKLYQPTHIHKHHGGSSCNICNEDKADIACEKAIQLSCTKLKCDEGGKVVRRTRLEKIKEDAPTIPPSPRIHFGTVASANVVMKSGYHRDLIAKEDNVIAFEMEAAGVLDPLPSVVVIKGVCDYADSHKHKIWQPYAAVTAAACMKAFLELKEEYVGMSPKEQLKNFIQSDSSLQEQPITNNAVGTANPPRPPLWGLKTGAEADNVLNLQQDGISQGNPNSSRVELRALYGMHPHEQNEKPHPAALNAPAPKPPVVYRVPQSELMPAGQTTPSNTQNPSPATTNATPQHYNPASSITLDRNGAPNTLQASTTGAYGTFQSYRAAEPVPSTQAIIPSAQNTPPTQAGSGSSPEITALPINSVRDVASSILRAGAIQTAFTPQPAGAANTVTLTRTLSYDPQPTPPQQLLLQRHETMPQQSQPHHTSHYHPSLSLTESINVNLRMACPENLSQNNQPQSAIGLGLGQTELYRVNTDPASDQMSSESTTPALSRVGTSLSKSTTFSQDDEEQAKSQCCLNKTSPRSLYSDKATPIVSVLEVNSPETNLLLKACKDRSLSNIKALLKKPTLVDLNATESRGNMLHLVIGSGNANADKARRAKILAIISLLCEQKTDPLDKKAFINATDSAGLTPLHHCAKTNNKESAIYLLDQGANIHASDVKGRTTLYYAAVEARPDFDFVKKLVLRQAKLGRVKLPPLRQQPGESLAKIRAYVARVKDCGNLIQE